MHGRAVNQPRWEIASHGATASFPFLHKFHVAFIALLRVTFFKTTVERQSRNESPHPASIHACGSRIADSLAESRIGQRCAAPDV